MSKCEFLFNFFKCLCRRDFLGFINYTLHMSNIHEREWFRPKSFNAEIILLDGLTGTGKTMLMSIVDCFSNVSIPRFDYQLEQICIGLFESKIDKHAGLEMLELLLDQRIYDVGISREVNFRPKDLSSVLKSTKRLKYMSRLLAEPRVNHLDNYRIEEKLFLIVHQLLETSNVLLNLPRKHVKRILSVRHPYYLFDHWASYVDMHGTSPRDFTVMLGSELQTPWFIRENQELFNGHSAHEKAAIAIAELTCRQEKFIANNKDILVVDFEKFVLEPNSYIDRIDGLLNSKSRGMHRAMKKSNLPRIHINNSRKARIYRRYGSDALGTSYSHRDDYLILKEKIRNAISPKHFKQIQLAAEQYEMDFGLWF